MKTTLAIIADALQAQPAAAIAVSGGDDSLVLTDIILRRLGARLPLVYADSQMDYPGTWDFVQQVATHYGTEAFCAKANRTPEEQWRKSGWPMLGKLAARQWSQDHSRRQMGFRCDVSSCCERMKISPVRRLMKARGLTLQFTGVRGQQDDALRGMRALKDGATYYVKSAGLWVSNPLTGWTDTMVRRYLDQHQLTRHPAKARGAQTIGCLYCGGGAQFDNSGFRILRHSEPALWRRFVVDLGAGAIILAIKYDERLPIVEEALRLLGGLAAVYDQRPWVFDFLRIVPLPGYDRLAIEPGKSEDVGEAAVGLADMLGLAGE